LQRAARLANGLQPLAARVRHAAHHTPAPGCALLSADGTALQTLQQVATICGRLQQTTLCCNRLRCWSVAADRTVLHSSLQQVATGCGLLQRTALCCRHRSNRLQRAVVCCNGPWSSATACGLLQRIALCCHHRCNRLQRAAVYYNGLWSVVSGSHCVAIIAATGCNRLWSVATGRGLLQRPVVCWNGLHCVAIAATGCNELWPVAANLWSVATGCAALRRLLRHTLYCEQRCNRLQRAAVGCNRSRCVATRCAALHQVRLRHGRLHCVANRLLRCGTERRCHTRCAVGTDGKSCWLRRFTTMLSAVATGDALLQRIGNRVGCVVARTC
jgi:hypothetical protein